MTEPSTPDIVLALFEANNSTAVTVSTVPVEFTPKDLEVTDTLTEATVPSTISFKLPFSESTWELLTEGRVVRVLVRDTVVAAYKLRTVAPTPIPEKGGEALVSFTGVSLVQALDDWVIPLRPDTESFAGATNKRLVSGWQLPEYDASGWSDPDYGNFSYDPLPPLAFFSPFAQWITHPDAVAGDTLLFVIDFVPGQPILIPRRTAVGGCKAWLNGFPIGDTPMPPSNAKDKTYRWPVNVDPAETYRLAIEVQGPDDAIPELLCETYAVADVDTGRLNTGSFLFQTGNLPDGPDGDVDPDPAPWKVYRVTGTTRPGMKTGQVLNRMIEEAQDAGQWTGLTASFTDSLDSNGVAWDETQNYITDVQKTAPQFLAQFAASEADVTMDPEGLVLHAYRWRERGDYHLSPTAPKFVGGALGAYATDATLDGNLTSFGYSQQLVPSDVTVHYRHREGFDTLGSGPMRAYDFGDIDPEAARALAQSIIDSRPDKAVTFTSTLFSRNGDDRFPEDLWLGDAGSLPAGNPAVWGDQRAMSITMTLNESGTAIPQVEWSSPQAELQAQFDRRLARLHAGIQAESITAPDLFGTTLEGGEAREESMLFSSQGADVPVEDLSETSAATPFPPGRWRMFRFHATAAAAPVDFVGWDFTLNGVAFHSAALESGESETTPQDGWIGDHVGVWKDLVRVLWTERGSGCEGFDVTVYYTNWY